MSARATIDKFMSLQRAMYAGGDLDALRDLLAEDVVWHVPGRSSIAGEHRGRDAVLEYFRRRRDIAGGTLRITHRGEVERDGLLVQLADGSAVIGGRRATWRTAGLYRVSEGRLAEAWLIPADLDAFDAIWTVADQSPRPEPPGRP